MPHDLTRRIFAGLSGLSLLLTVGLALKGAAQASDPPPGPAGDQSPITNLRQLTRVMNSESPVFRDVQLNVVVCAASKPEIGVLIARDETGVGLFELGDFGREIFPGEKIQIQHWYCYLRKRDMGVEISTAPTIDNDGIHFRPRIEDREVTLKAGPIPLRLDWFNCLHNYALDVSFESSNGSWQKIPDSALWHSAPDEAPGGTNLLPGLRAECYEGYWENLPDFNLLRPVKTGVATNFDLKFRTRDEMVGMRFTGFFNAPYDGKYTFRLSSDDGSMLFLRDPAVPIKTLGRAAVPTSEPGVLGENMDNLDEQRWVTVEGSVDFISKTGAGLEFELRSDRDSIWVKVADAAGVDPSSLLNSEVRITGVGLGVHSVDNRIVFGRLMVATAKEITVVESGDAKGKLPSLLTTARQVQGLPVEDARHELPVRIHGVVTSANIQYDHWMSIQDDTRGIWVNLHNISNTVPACGEIWEVVGHSGAGDFAPIVFADRITFLGVGRMPEPVRPTWNELINGSMDVQWAEFQGLVTDVQSNNVTLMLPEGHLTAQMEGYQESDLKPFLKADVRIRGTLYAVWDASTREVRVGNVLMRNAIINVEQPAPDDPFDALMKKPRELLLFDAQATAFRRVKVRGQIVYADATQVYLEDNGAGLRLLPSEKTDLRSGDLVEAVGYPDIGRTTLLLNEVILRKTGEARLPAARITKESELSQNNLDSTRISVQGKLLGWHLEQGAQVLEMQSGQHLYLARLAPGTSGQVSLRAGSRLALEGVYVARGRNQVPNTGAESFDLLVNSPADIVVRSQPSWWTLQRLLIVVGMLLVVLAFTAIWITQLRRVVEQRTAQLQREIRERERVERQHALEAERSRIARDLHDDLGSSLTEISVLANTGQRPEPGETSLPKLFHTIAGKARSLIAALDVIVWAVDPEDNSLQSLGDYLTGYAEEFFSHTNISCRFKVPVAFPQITLDGRVRHDLLLAVKETLNNIVRHAEATEMEFCMAVAGGDLEIGIADNGKGFEGGGDGHGLKNLSARLLKLGGTCAVESCIGGGTTVKIRLPLAAPVGTEASPAKADTTFD
ncbi:MAG TPA: ATP-binding protein [Verrucomicrobiae bacterium]|jgi:signal transduction histidine kinase